MVVTVLTFPYPLHVLPLQCLQQVRLPRVVHVLKHVHVKIAKTIRYEHQTFRLVQVVVWHQRQGKQGHEYYDNVEQRVS